VLTNIVSRSKCGTSANHLRSGFFFLDFIRFSLAMASKNTLSREQVVSAQASGDYTIKSDDKQPVLDTSQWPLLLKHYDKLLIRSSHFTPIPSGCSPLKRDIENYVRRVHIFVLRPLTDHFTSTIQVRSD